MDEELDPREDARARRRDRDADAARRDLMRPGMGKVFKQITRQAGPRGDRARARKGRIGSVLEGLASTLEETPNAALGCGILRERPWVASVSAARWR